MVITDEESDRQELIAGVPDDPEKPWVDAIFFSRSAVEKFVVPYAAALYGPETATRMLGLYGKNGEYVVLRQAPTVFAALADQMLLDGFISVDELLERAAERTPSKGVGMSRS